MSDDELGTILNSLEQESTAYNSEFMKINEEQLRRYNQEPYGDEEDGYSQVVASDVRDLVDSDMTSLVRVFLGSGDVFVFEPATDEPEDVEEAKTKTQYINHLILKRPGQYKIIHDFIKDSERQKMGVTTYYMETVKETREVWYKKQTDIELTKFMEDMLATDAETKEVEIVEKKQKDNEPVFDVRLRITREYQELIIKGIPTEDFLLTKGSATIDDAQMVGHVSYPTRSELVASGMKESEVDDFPTETSAGTGLSGTNQDNGSYSQSTAMKSIRWRDEGGDITDADAFGEWSAETVKMSTMFAKVDFDGDGIAERRRFVKIGNTVTENEPYDHVPYAVGSCILEPHKAIGDGRAALVMEDQSVNTALDRALLDNTYDATRPRTVLGDGINQDDFLDHRSDGIVRMNKGSGQSPGEAVFPLLTPYIGDKALMTLQYREQQTAQRTGTMLDSQGLEADQLHKETATRFTGMEQAREAKIELVARNLAETGFRKLYEGVAWTVNRFQDKEQQVRITGKAITVNPSDWKYPSLAVSQVGLGAGSGQKTVQQMNGILQIQNQLKAEGSLLVDDKKTFNSLDKMVQGLGLARTSDYFNNPDIPQDVIFAQYQQLVVAMQQSQQMIEQLTQQAELSNVARIEAEGKLQLGREKNQLDAAKFDASLEKDQIEMIKDAKQFQAEQTFKYTELEVENNVDVPGEGQGQ